MKHITPRELKTKRLRLRNSDLNVQFLYSHSMICIETQHFHLNRILLLAIGLWPYPISKFVRLQIILFSGILTSFVIFQFTAFITTKCTVDFIIKVFSTAIIFNFYVIIYNMFWINTHHVRNLLKQLQCICNELKDENELAIIKKYGYNTRRCTAIITFLCIGGTTMTATGTMILGCFIHACGMFHIASYRIEQAMSTKMLKNINLKNQTMINKKIFYAVEIHRKAMKFIDMLISSFEGSFLLLIMFCVISLSLNIFAVFYNASLGNKEALLLHLSFVFAIYLYMFLTNYIGQEVTNYSNNVYSTAYNVRWYMAPLHTQKMILFILQKGSITFDVNIAGLFVMSLQCFATLTKASMSYFTFMYSTQQ
ncbi:odorant receptor 22c-like isoform X2 [Polyergus mexicanus]|uniref:odorant receptor 22c-like isoform X2 n=1 Tax=Polyergus mexicanus TaxID=615972 RepID=UPI0038B482DC